MKGVAVLVRELLLAAVLLLALAAVVFGVSLIFVPAAWILGGLGVAALGFFFLAEVNA